MSEHYPGKFITGYEPSVYDQQNYSQKCLFSNTEKKLQTICFGSRIILTRFVQFLQISRSGKLQSLISQQHRPGGKFLSSPDNPCQTGNCMMVRVKTRSAGGRSLLSVTLQQSPPLVSGWPPSRLALCRNLGRKTNQDIYLTIKRLVRFCQSQFVRH